MIIEIDVPSGSEVVKVDGKDAAFWHKQWQAADEGRDYWWNRNLELVDKSLMQQDTIRDLEGKVDTLNHELKAQTEIAEVQTKNSGYWFDQYEAMNSRLCAAEREFEERMKTAEARIKSEGEDKRIIVGILKDTQDELERVTKKLNVAISFIGKLPANAQATPHNMALGHTKMACDVYEELANG